MANNDEEQNKIEQAKQTVEQVKEASKLAANAASGNVLGAAKSAIKLLKDKNFKKKLKRKLIMIALQAMIPIIIAAFLLGAINAIKDEMIDLLANAGTSVGGFLSRAWQWFTNDYWIKLDEGTEYFIDADTGETLGTKDTITDADLLNEKGETRNTATKVETIVDQYVRDLGNQGVSLQSLRLLGDADYSDTDKLLENEENKVLVEKYIAEFIRADVITQQPHRRRGEGELVNQNNQNWIDGGIYIYRTKKEPTIDEDKLINGEYHEDDIEVEDQDYIQMTYMKYDEFQETLQKVNQNNIYNYNEERSLIKTLREHFTIDSNTGELVIAKIKSTITKESEVRIDENTSLLGKWFDKISEWWQSATSTKEVYEITEERLDYKQLISKYTMPYEFLIQLCEITQNPEFVYHVALLARNTKIVLVVQDNITIERETNEKEQDIKRYENSTSNSRVDASITDEYTKQIRKVTITTTQTPVLKVKSADTWSFYEEFKYTKNVNATKTEEGPRTTLWSIPNVLSHEESSKQVTGYRGDGSTYLIDYPGYWWDEFVTQERTATQTVTSETTYNEPICENPIEKSKQFLGLLRNDTGTCPYDNCFEEKKNPTKGDPIALYCAQEAIFERNGTNVQYRIPNMTRTESPLNRLTSGIEMLYAVLQSNSSGYEEKDLMLSTEQIGESFDIQNQYIADGDYESAYIVKMQGLVEHLRYLMTFPENENYTPIELPENGNDDESGLQIDDIIVKTDEPGAAPEVTEEELRCIIDKAYSSDKIKNNALSLVETVIKGQEDYHVNPIFMLAIAKIETSMGTADSTYVKEKNNWTNYALSATYNNPIDNMQTTINAIANGRNYFTQGKYTIKEIGYTYCPNEPDHPHQGDDWVTNVTKEVRYLYSKIGGNAGGEFIDIYYTTYTSTKSGRTYRIYRQNDYPNVTYGTDPPGTIASKGCGLTSDATVLSGYGCNLNPPQLLNGRNIISMDGELRNHGLSVTRSNGASEIIIKNALNLGKPIIVHVKPPSSYTKNEHWMPLLDVRENNGETEVYVANPNRNTKDGWDKLSNVLIGCVEYIIINSI